jgi:hypothetical protein
MPRLGGCHLRSSASRSPVPPDAATLSFMQGLAYVPTKPSQAQSARFSHTEGGGHGDGGSRRRGERSLDRDGRRRIVQPQARWAERAEL